MSDEMRPPDGEKIASEIERELQERLYRLRHVTLAPAEYHVYLHPDDFVYLEAIVPRIVEDVQMCLNALIERVNRPSLWKRVTAAPQPAPVEVPAGGWVVYIKPAVNGEIDRGEFVIHSRLAVPFNARFGSGAGTIRIAETHVTPTERRSRPLIATGVPAETAPPSVPTSAPTTGVDEVPPRRPIPMNGPRLMYRDETGDHLYPITKELTKIGRGGSEHWVDVMVATSPQVSREHCRIRRDESGRLFLQDVSTCGTFLNGSQVERFVPGAAAQREYELSDRASIRLADAVTLEVHLQ